MTVAMADLAGTTRFSDRRFEQSPYRSCYDSPDMVHGVYAGRVFPLRDRHDPALKYRVLRTCALLYDVPERPVEISGPDVCPFLEKVFSRRISTLEEGRGRYAIACTPQGGVFMDGILFKLADERYWYVQPDGALETWLVAHSEGYDVSVSNPQSRVLQIQGPASLDIMQAASAGAINNAMSYFRSGYFHLQGQEVYVSRTGFTGELGFEIYSQGKKTDHLQLWNHLMACGERYGLEFSCVNSMEIRRIEAGILDNTTDMTMSTTPFDVGLTPFVELDKEDFVGRNSLLNADKRTRLYGVKCDDALPIMHQPVVENGRIVGRITAGAYSPYLQCYIGFVLFDEPNEWVGRSLELGADSITGAARAGQRLFDCEIVELPFYDKDKRIARGFDTKVPDMKVPEVQKPPKH